MDIKTLNKEDFKITSSCTGYMVYYKNNPIGGAGIKGQYKGRNKMKQIQDTLESGQRDISNILQGRMYESQKLIIQKLNN